MNEICEPLKVSDSDFVEGTQYELIELHSQGLCQGLDVFTLTL